MKKGKRRIHHRAANKFRELFSKKQPHSREADARPDSVTNQASGEPPAPPPLDPPLQGGNGKNGGDNGAQHENDAHPNPYAREQLRLTRRLTTATVFIAIATVIYMVFSGYQSCKIRESVEVGRQQANTAQAQASIAQTQTNLTERSVNISANTAAKITEQNERAINATEKQANASVSQAGTSKIATDAARDSAQTARQLYESGQRPRMFFKWVRWREKPVVNKKFDVEFAQGNNGGAAYEHTLEMTVAVIPTNFAGLLPYGPGQDGQLISHSSPDIERDEAPFEQGADQTSTTDFTLILNETGMKLFEDEKLLIVFYGHVWWKDSLGRPDGFSFCRVYNKKTYPNLTYCLRRIQIPKGAYPY
jgi:hypothetical protein